MNFKEEFQLYSFENVTDPICAEVFISSEQLFYISCRFCDKNTFKNYEKFTKHFYENHIDNKIENRIEERNTNYTENILNEIDFVDSNIETETSKEEILDNNNSTMVLSSTFDDNNVSCDATDTNSIINSKENAQHQQTILKERIFYEKAENMQLNNFDNKKYQCNLCPTKFWTFEQLSLHEIIHNFKQITSGTKHTPKHKFKLGKLQRQFDKNSNRFKCSECFSSFWSIEQLKLHKTSHNLIDNNSKVKTRNKSIDELMIEQPIEAFYNKILEKNKLNTKQCDTCGMCFSSVTSLKRHIMKHTGERPYKCEHCSRGFIRRQALILHLGAHSGEKQFKCEQCDKAYYRKDALQHHMKVHSDNVFYCSYCNKKFKINSEKIYHERRHNNINRKRPFKSRKQKKLSAPITKLTATKSIQDEILEIKKELVC